MSQKEEPNNEPHESIIIEDEPPKKLTTSEKKALREQIKHNRQLLKNDKEIKPKRTLSQKQLNALAEGRKKNPKLKKLIE